MTDIPQGDAPTPRQPSGEAHHPVHPGPNGADVDGQGEGTAAVLRALMTMLGEALQSLDRRMAALETAAALQASVDRLEDVARTLDTTGYGLASLADGLSSRARSEEEGESIGPEDFEQLHAGLQEVTLAVHRITASARDHQHALDAVRGDLSSLGTAVAELGSRMEATEQQVLALVGAVASMHESLKEHAEETASSLGQRATQAGRRLATDLGLFSRTRRPPDPDELKPDR